MFRLLSCVLFVSVAVDGAVRPANLDRIIEETRKAFEYPGVAVAIVEGDKLVYAKGFGVKKLGSSEVVTPDTRFAIGSTTKAFTTTAMGILVDENKMAWDDPVRKHVPFFRLADPLADANVTLRDIVCHRTGLSRNDLLWYNSPWPREEIIRRIGLVPLTRPYRSAYQYQNIMFLTAGYAVGLVDGSSWESFVTRRILTPLGMKNTDFSANDVVHARDYSTPHEKRDDAVTVVPWRNIDNVGPAGSINSSVNDLAKWVRLQLNGGVFEGQRILKEATLRETHTPQMVVRMDDPNSRTVNEGTQMMSYGLAWMVQDYRGHHMVSHGGAIDGFRAQITLLPSDKFGIIILGNLGGNNMPECLRASLADELLGLPDKDWNRKYLAVAKQGTEREKKQKSEREAKRLKNTRPSLELDGFAGAFDHPAYGPASVHKTGDGLELHWSNWKLPLAHHHLDVFAVQGEAGSLSGSLVEFRLDADAKVAAVKFADQEFRRKP